jgi:UPF0716 protein FxsA
MIYLLLIFILTPLVELYLLIKLGMIIGALNTVLLVILTGFLGALLARSQGFKIFKRINDELEQGIIPSEALIDGFFVLVGGLLLITPGILTDIVGFLLVIPYTREPFKSYIKYKLKDMADRRSGMHFRYYYRHHQ